MMLCASGDVPSFAILVSVVALSPGVDAVSSSERNQPEKELRSQPAVAVEKVVANHVGGSLRLEW